MCNTVMTGSALGLTDKNHACTCGTDSPAAATGISSQGVVRERYLVDGMTCSHCVSSVTEEISALDGVRSVRIDLNAGGTSRVMVISSAPVSTDDIRAAVAEAGYSLVTS